MTVPLSLAKFLSSGDIPSFNIGLTGGFIQMPVENPKAIWLQ